MSTLGLHIYAYNYMNMSKEGVRSKTLDFRVNTLEDFEITIFSGFEDFDNVQVK